MRYGRAAIAALAILALAGCEHKLTLEEAQAKCDKQGGLLTVIYVQKVTMGGPEPEVIEPGNCMSANAFDKPAEKPADKPVAR